MFRGEPGFHAGLHEMTVNAGVVIVVQNDESVGFVLVQPLADFIAPIAPSPRGNADDLVPESYVFEKGLQGNWLMSVPP